MSYLLQFILMMPYLRNQEFKVDKPLILFLEQQK